MKAPPTVTIKGKKIRQLEKRLESALESEASVAELYANMVHSIGGVAEIPPPPTASNQANPDKIRRRRKEGKESFTLQNDINAAVRREKWYRAKYQAIEKGALAKEEDEREAKEQDEREGKEQDEREEKREQGRGEEEEAKEAATSEEKEKRGGVWRKRCEKLEVENEELRLMMEWMEKRAIQQMRIMHVDLERVEMILHGVIVPDHRKLIDQYKYQVIRGRLNLTNIMTVESIGVAICSCAQMVIRRYYEKIESAPCRDDLRDLLSVLRRECGQLFVASFKPEAVPCNDTAKWISTVAQEITLGVDSSSIARSYFWRVLQIFWALQISDQALTILYEFDGKTPHAFTVNSAISSPTPLPLVLLPAIVSGELIACAGEVSAANP